MTKAIMKMNSTMKNINNSINTMTNITEIMQNK